MLEDAELLHRYTADRDETAFAELVRRHINLVYSVALRRVDGRAHLAGDVTQSVFTDLARKASSLAGHAMLTAWLFTSTRYAAAQIMRSERRRELHKQEAHTMQELLGNESTTAEWEKLRPVIDDVLDQLNARDREAILLRFYEGRHFAGVGAALRLSEDAARMRVDRALDKLGGLLAKRGVRSTAGALAIVLANQTVTAAPTGLVNTVAGAALAQLSAAAGGGVASAFVNFMSTAKIAGIAAVGLVALGSGLFYQAQAHRAEAAIAGMVRESDDLHARLREFNGRIATVDAAAAEPVRESLSSTSPAGTASSANTTAMARHAVTQELLGNERFNQLKLQSALADIRSGRGLFYQRLGLTPEQIKQFVTILSDALAAAWQVNVSAQLASRDANDPETRASLQQVRQRMEDGIRGMLGESGLTQFVEHERAKKAEGFAQLMALNLYFTDSPVAPEQGRQIAEILTRHSPDFQQGGDFNLTHLDNDKLLADAASVLAPLQLQSLRDLLEFEAYQRELSAARRAAAGGKTP